MVVVVLSIGEERPIVEHTDAAYRITRGHSQVRPSRRHRSSHSRLTSSRVVLTTSRRMAAPPVRRACAGQIRRALRTVTLHGGSIEKRGCKQAPGIAAPSGASRVAVLG